ncbi:hypothetical protein ACFSOZ_36695 [Mesorhizobium newzealandense]|uniref:Uncharacterized protein n=1 Tax=Mesorhizobium newzealandense TaxID=1300302 RepID=A0ABW4UPI6_9HYPH
MPDAKQQSTNNSQTQGCKGVKAQTQVRGFASDKKQGQGDFTQGALPLPKNPFSTLFIGAKLRHPTVILAGRSRSCEEPANETTMSKRQK